MDAQSLFTDYAQIIGLPGLSFDENGCARLNFSGFAVNFEADSSTDFIQLYAVLAPVPAGSNAALYRSLLEGNLFCAHTQGATLSIDPVQNEVLLCRRVEMGTVDAMSFSKVVSSFAATAAAWTRTIASASAGADDTAARDPAREQPIGMYLRG